MDKALYVREMFAEIAPRYDATNRILTAGADEGWRKRAIAELAAPPNASLLDLCCGTGDLAFHLVRTDPTVRVTGAALRLPFDDAVFDGATMGFAMRNVVDIAATLREVRRVLRPGARFVNLDVSKAPNRLFRRLFDLYFYRVVPFVGGRIGGSKSAYRYLPNSLTNYPDADELAARFRTAGFADVRYTRLAGGAIAVHRGVA